MGVSKVLAVFLVLAIAASAHGETYFNKPVPPSMPLCQVLVGIYSGLYQPKAYTQRLPQMDMHQDKARDFQACLCAIMLIVRQRFGYSSHDDGP